MPSTTHISILNWGILNEMTYSVFFRIRQVQTRGICISAQRRPPPDIFFRVARLPPVLLDYKLQWRLPFLSSSTASTSAWQRKMGVIEFFIPSSGAYQVQRPEQYLPQKMGSIDTWRINDSFSQEIVLRRRITRSNSVMFIKKSSCRESNQLLAGLVGKSRKEADVCH